MASTACVNCGHVDVEGTFCINCGKPRDLAKEREIPVASVATGVLACSNCGYLDRATHACVNCKVPFGVESGHHQFPPDQVASRPVAPGQVRTPAPTATRLASASTALLACSNCGYLDRPTAKCTKCGASFEDGVAGSTQLASAAAPQSAAPARSSVPAVPSTTNLKACPNCGYLDRESVSCRQCGIRFDAASGVTQLPASGSTIASRRADAPNRATPSTPAVATAGTATMVTCTNCGAVDRDSEFCKRCGKRREPQAIPASALVGLPPAYAPAASSAPAAPSGASRALGVADKVATGVSTVFTVVVGLVWIVIGIVLLGLGAAVAWSILFGILAIIYGIYLLIPGRSKFVIY